MQQIQSWPVQEFVVQVVCVKECIQNISPRDCTPMSYNKCCNLDKGSSKEPQNWMFWTCVPKQNKFANTQSLALQLLPIRPREIHAVDHKETTGSALIKSNGSLPQVRDSQMMQGRYPMVWACLTFCTSMTQSTWIRQGWRLRQNLSKQPKCTRLYACVDVIQVAASWRGRTLTHCHVK